MKAKKCHAFFVCITICLHPTQFKSNFSIKNDGAEWDITRRKENEENIDYVINRFRHYYSC